MLVPSLRHLPSLSSNAEGTFAKDDILQDYAWQHCSRCVWHWEWNAWTSTKQTSNAHWIRHIGRVSMQDYLYSNIYLHSPTTLASLLSWGSSWELARTFFLSFRPKIALGLNISVGKDVNWMSVALHKNKQAIKRTPQDTTQRPTTLRYLRCDSWLAPQFNVHTFCVNFESKYPLSNFSGVSLDGAEIFQGRLCISKSHNSKTNTFEHLQLDVVWWEVYL